MCNLHLTKYFWTNSTANVNSIEQSQSIIYMSEVNWQITLRKLVSGCSKWFTFPLKFSEIDFFLHRLAFF